MSNKKINPDNLSRVNGAFKDMILMTGVTERERERKRTLLCYNRHRFCCLGERNEESNFYNFVVNTWRVRKCK